MLDPQNCQKFAIWAPSHNLLGYIFATKARINNRKKNLLNSNVSPTRPHNMVNFGLLVAEISSLVWGTPANFIRFSCLRFVTAATSLNGNQPNFARCLAISWAGTLCIQFPGLLSCNGILPGTKFTLRPSLALS